MPEPLLLLVMTATVATSSVAAEPSLVETATVAASVALATTPRPTTRPEDARGYVDSPSFGYADVLLFVPRVLLTPPRWILTAVFWPIEKGLELIEDTRLIEHTVDLLYNDARTAGVFPTLDVLSSQGASFGARVFHNDLFGNEESISASARAGGIVQQAYDLSFAADRLGDTPFWLETQVRWDRSPSLFFRGIGDLAEAPTSGVDLDPYAAAVDSQFAQDRFLGRLRFGTSHGREDRRIKAGVSLIYNHRRFNEAQRLGGGERSIGDVYRTNEIPGFTEGTSLFEVTADLVIDFRNRQGQTSQGLLAEAFVGGVPDQNQFGYFHWGTEATLFIELFAKTRVLVLHAAIEGVEGERSAIPLSSFARLGGPGRLRGYRVDAFRDEKAIATSASYNYPIHQYMTGVLFADAGRVANNYSDLADVGTWRIGGGGGLRFGSEDSTFFEVDFAYGDGFFFYLSTDPFRSFSGRTERL